MKNNIETMKTESEIKNTIPEMKNTQKEYTVGWKKQGSYQRSGRQGRRKHALRAIKKKKNPFLSLQSRYI